MIDLYVAVGIVLLGFFCGKAIEKKHYSSIRKREEKLAGVHVIPRTSEEVKNTPGVLMHASTVVSIDAYKKFISGFINFFGGNVSAYESLLDRARRESLLRLKDKVQSAGYDTIMHLRYETSPISGKVRDSVGSVEVLVYGTAHMRSHAEDSHR